MVSGLAIKMKNYAANMGSGFVVIAGFLLAITTVFVVVFARWNYVKNDISFSEDIDKPRIESSIDDSGCVSVFIPEIDEEA